MAFYELTYIVRPDVASNQPEQLAKKFAAVVAEKGGKVIKTEQWGLRSLSFRVKKHRKGYYTMLGLEADGAIISEVERQMRISDDVIRFLSVNVEELSKEPSVMMNPRNRRNREEAEEAESA